MSKNNKNSNKHHALLSGIILAGFALRLYQLGAQSLWYDETVSAFLAGLSPLNLIAHTARDIHPPAYYLLLHVWAKAAGNSEFTLAFFSAWFGVLLIPLTYVLSRYLINPTAAIWAALLVAASPYGIWYSQEVRMYTLGAAMGLVAAYCLLKAFRRNRPIYWAGYLIASTIGLYALYYFFFMLTALNLFFLVYLLTTYRPRFKAWLVTNALLLVIYLPWLPIAWRQATNPPVPPWRSMPPLWHVALESWTALALGQSVDPGEIWPLLLVVLALFVVGLIYIRPTPTRLFLLTYTFGPLALILLLSVVTPLYHVRYLFTYAPAFYIIVGAGFVWLSQKTRLWLALGVAAIVLGASSYAIIRLHVDPQYRTDDFRAAVEFIETRWRPGDAILINAGYTHTAFEYYADLPNLRRTRLVPYPSIDANTPVLLQTGTVNGDSQLGWGDLQSDFYAMSSADTLAALDQLVADYPRLWQLRAYDTVTDPDGLIRAWLDENATPLEDQVFAGTSNIRAQGYLLKPSTPLPAQNIAFEDGMGLAGWDGSTAAWQPGQTIPVKLWWTASATPGVDYKMSLKLWTPEGQLAAQGQDEWPGGALFRATHWPANQIVYHPAQITLPANLSPGQYWLNVELYHPDTLQPLSRLDDGSTVVTLGPVQVVAP